MPPLKERLIEKIRSDGPVSFAAFMREALYDPFEGYYAAGRARIGKEGDFFTSVSVSSLFGALLAQRFIQMWEQLGRPTEWTLVEQGAFDGQLSFDVLSAIEKASPECFGSVTLRIVEPFSLLQSRQARMLQKFNLKVVWHRCVNSLPMFTGVHFSNELMDAFPVHQLVFREGGWRERVVAWGASGFSWSDSARLSEGLAAAAATLTPGSEGTLREVCLETLPWLESIATRMRRGWLLAVDYGLREEELALAIRRDGTISSYASHRRKADPLQNPGEQDTTSHVNFSRVVSEAEKVGWEFEELTEQHRFLARMASSFFGSLTAENGCRDPEIQRQVRAFQSLAHPQMLGHHFKVMTLRRGASTRV